MTIERCNATNFRFALARAKVTGKVGRLVDTATYRAEEAKRMGWHGLAKSWAADAQAARDLKGDAK